MKYLDKELMERMCHRLAVALFDTENDPISPFTDRDDSLLESALNLPRSTFGGQDLYPDIVDKATALYYAINKNHAFRNGNKRISTASLIVFLYINEYWLNVGTEELAQKTLEIAQSKREDRETVIATTREWVRAHIAPLETLE